jgi:hypothetical protein
MNEMRDMIKQVLETPYWIPTLKADKPYFITNDDCDGKIRQGITVIIDSQGDAWVTVDGNKGYGTSRIRTFNGGGHNHRTRNALMILAEAIRLDNEKRLD